MNHKLLYEIFRSDQCQFNAYQVGRLGLSDDHQPAFSDDYVLDIFSVITIKSYRFSRNHFSAG
ncbi:MAG: hypothetical protein KA076_05445 [Candidatus Marinimicrobia bacterium]|nr:hypothetical protein [Candidatus Neomarinimicrobiota bacterium]HNZ36976.1 hypothetical protein [Candidatus Neomarinimicrobiota bacterium]HOD38755.1 hypothetical protein [Candidatus Neomarinimicrobiota bacterium]HOV23036.1 hypothetical protein [Candidatus Neomarinimicrobiota bacterium]HPA99863.1 hypothetical protein [Candidatus Neomarinimicrobiota bacterium]